MSSISQHEDAGALDVHDSLKHNILLSVACEGWERKTPFLRIHQVLGHAGIPMNISGSMLTRGSERQGKSNCEYACGSK